MPRSSAQRSATQNSPSSARSVQPTAPAYQPRSSPSSAGISGNAPRRAARRPPPASASSIPASSTAGSGSASCARIGVARCWTFWTLTSTGSSARRDPDADRLERALDPARDDRLLLAVLVAAQQLLAEVVVDRRVRAAARGAGERDRLGARRRRGAPAARGSRRRRPAPACRRTSSSRPGRPRAARRGRRRGRAAVRRGRAPRGPARASRARPARIRSTARSTACS